MEEALTRLGVPEIFNTDQGSQFTSTAFTAILHREKIAISMDDRCNGRCPQSSLDRRMPDHVYFNQPLLAAA